MVRTISAARTDYRGQVDNLDEKSVIVDPNDLYNVSSG